MLMIPAYLGQSGVHGIGVYASAPVKAGDKIWEFNSAVDFIYDSRWLTRLCRQSPKVFDYFCLYAYKRYNQYYYVTDNSRFINHSVNANIAFDDNSDEIALTDINAGDELLENYLHSYDADDCFVLEMNNIDLRQYFSLQSSKRKSIINNIHNPTISLQAIL